MACQGETYEAQDEHKTYGPSIREDIAHEAAG